MAAKAKAEAEEALLSFKILNPDVALEAAQAALADCRERGFQVAVSVVDRFGNAQVLLRDRVIQPPRIHGGKRWLGAGALLSAIAAVVFWMSPMARISSPGKSLSRARSVLSSVPSRRTPTTTTPNR